MTAEPTHTVSKEMAQLSSENWSNRYASFSATLTPQDMYRSYQYIIIVTIKMKSNLIHMTTFWTSTKNAACYC